MHPVHFQSHTAKTISQNQVLPISAQSFTLSAGLNPIFTSTSWVPAWLLENCALCFWTSWNTMVAQTRPRTVSPHRLYCLRTRPCICHCNWLSPLNRLKWPNKLLKRLGRKPRRSRSGITGRETRGQDKQSRPKHDWPFWGNKSRDQDGSSATDSSDKYT